MNTNYESINTKRRSEFIKASFPVALMSLGIAIFSFFITRKFILNGQTVTEFSEANNLALYGTLVWIGFLLCVAITVFLSYSIYSINKSLSTPKLNKYESWIGKSVYVLILSLVLICIGWFGLK